ncbi:MAG TPA: chorismate mutase [Spirochaetota bacterium]|nr:chorismate mutase [Spirochaetota bacterium]HPJ40474.1 chorismate mutase [Spirochaetota bacterium]HPQ54170.1 chorismate mutase [Spirochaetota bacterium]
MTVRGIRGATTVTENTRDEIIEKTKELLDVLVKKNNLNIEDIASAIFSVTDDVTAEFPAVAARKIGWLYTPLFCTKEIPVPGSLNMCIRVLLHVNSTKKQEEMIHEYLYEARKLRPDLDTGEKDRYYSSEK